MPNNYPTINIRSKRELAKHISGKGIDTEQALALINEVIANYDELWRDNPKMSEPKKEKWVRDASRSKLGELHGYINERILSPYDNMLPSFIFGGVKGKNHVAAARHLQGRRRKRTMLKLDISRFFEQNHYNNVNELMKKCGCGYRGSRLIADLCCVASGPKNNPVEPRTLARGFATSSRLAVWCNLHTFIRLQRLVQRELKDREPRIAIYVDDIGITASKTSIEEMLALYTKVKTILEGGETQPLPLNDKKTKIILHSGETYDVAGNFIGKRSYEILGVQMNRSSLTLGTKSRWKLADATHRLSNGEHNDRNLRRTKKALVQYKNYVQNKKKS